MADKRSSAVYDHFQEVDNTFQCTVAVKGVTCNTVIPKLKYGSSSGNLKRHLQRHHPEDYNAVQEKDSSAAKKVNYSIRQMI